MTDIGILLYADDLAMLANSREELQDNFICYIYIVEIGLCILI